jgi:phage terminase Nu1 subunit (DNA packaging protein)
MKATDETNLAEVADLFGVSERRIQQLIAEGAIPKPLRHGVYVVETVVRAYVKHLQAIRRSAASSGPIGLQAERERLTRAKADIAEMEMDEKRGDLIPREEIEATWVNALSLLRTRLLSIPNQLAPQVHQEKNQAAVRDLIKSAIRGALDDLAEADVDTFDYTDGDGSAPSDPPSGLQSAQASA